MRTVPKKIKLPGLYFSQTGLVVALVSVSLLTLFAQTSTKSSNQIDQVLRHAVNEKKVPGIVAMVSVADKVTYQGAAGMRHSKIPMTMDSIFRIASMTKAITSVAVMQLVESGHVRLDEPASSGVTSKPANGRCPERLDVVVGRSPLIKFNLIFLPRIFIAIHQPTLVQSTGERPLPPGRTEAEPRAQSKTQSEARAERREAGLAP